MTTFRHYDHHLPPTTNRQPLLGVNEPPRPCVPFLARIDDVVADGLADEDCCPRC
jgi:hypothetical protein